MPHIRSSCRGALAVSLTAAAVAIVAGDALAHDPGYNVIDLGVLPGDDLSSAIAINQDGAVVGWSENFDGHRRAFHWAEGVRTELPTLSGSVSYEPVAINDSGVSVGFVELERGARVAVRWDESFQITRLLTGPGFGDSYATNINADGVIIGAVFVNQRGGYRGFRWENGNVTELGGLPGGGDTVAEGINDLGDIVGSAETSAGVRHAVMWDGDFLTDLGTLGGSESVATCINNAGQVSGWSDLGKEDVNAFLWEDGLMTTLGSLGSNQSWATDINRSRWIVGSSILLATGELNGVLWRPDRMININSLLLPGSIWAFLVDAEGVNDPGQVVGQGIAHGRFHAFLLEPMLGITDPIPGVAGEFNTFDAPGATPGNIVHFVYSLQTGETAVPGCPGVNVTLRNPTIMGRGRADEIGHATITLFVPAAAQGRTVFLQSVELATCEVSAMRTWRFF